MSTLQPNSIIPSKEGETLNDVLRRLEMVPTGRLEGASFINKTTGWAILTPLYQGHDESGQPPPPDYQLNTGVIVGATYVAPGTQADSQVQPQINVRATRVEANCRLRWLATGDEQEFTFTPAVAPPGKFFTHVGFGIQNALTAWLGKDKPPMPRMILEAEFDA
jgi:hypothetical protein